MSRIVLTPRKLATEMALARPREVERLQQLQAESAGIPRGYVLKIIWDDPAEYPEHALGFVQYTVRPYFIGYGCDGTTDRNIHLIAATVFYRIGIDYGQAYADAYPCEVSADRQNIINQMVDCCDQQIVAETIVPKENDLRTMQTILHDLYDINNRSLVETLTERLLENGFDQDVQNWYLIDFKTSNQKEQNS